MKKEKTAKANRTGFLSRNIYCIAAAAIAAVIMLFTYIAWKFFPFGENIILRMDLYHQYAPLFAELYERVFGGDSLIYSFTSGLGSSFLGNYFNYLSSPTMLFVLIFGHKNIPEAVAAMVLVKAAASAYTFTYFLGKITKKSDLSTTAFGLLYAFCGYFVAYYWNIMWLDAVVLFPIVILGIWYIIEKGRSLPYILSLAVIMMTNYYMAYMVCLLSVVFFLYFYFSKRTLGDTLNKGFILKAKYKRSVSVGALNSTFLVRGVTFAAASILAAMIAACALLPVYFILKNSSATNSNFPSSFASYFSIFDFLANHLAGVEPTIRSSGDTVYPNVYCGMLTLLLVPLFMFSRKFSLREKIATTAVSAFFFFSFNINVLNYIWHGFHFPNDLPYRFSFAYSFFLIFIAYRVFTVIDKIPGKSILGSACGVAAFAAIVEKVGSANVDLKVVWTSVIFVIVYAVVMAFIRNPKYVRSSIAILLLTSVCAELLIADTPNYKVTQTKTSYTSSYDDTKTVIDNIKETEGDDGFYRMELALLLTRMDNCWFYYPGVSTFTSMAYEDVAHLQDYLGLYGNKINSYTYNCQTGLYNSMMSLKYIVDNNDYVATDNYKPQMDGNFLYSKVDSYNDMTVYRNNYWLPVAFSVNDNLDTAWVYEDANPFVNQNDFYYNASGVADILSPLTGSVSDSRNIEPIEDSKVRDGEFSVYKENTGEASNEIAFRYEVPETQNVYVFVDSSDINSVLVNAGSFTYNQTIDGKSYVLDCGTVKAGTDVYITYSLKDDSISGSVKQYVYGMDQDKFKEAYNTIVKNGVLDVTENKEHYLKGTVNLAEGKMLYTSIPYDTAWDVYVDGEKLSADKIVKIGNALMGIKMDAGEHTVELRYTPNGMILGLVLTIIGILILVLLLILKKKKLFVYSDSYRADVLELGRWRDKGLEAAAQEEEERRRADFEETLRTSTEESLDPETEDAWQAALLSAEAFVKSQKQTEEPQEDAEPSENTDVSDGDDDAEKKTLIFESEGDLEMDFSDNDELFDEKTIDEVLDDFERRTEDIEKPKKNRLSVEDRKSAKKKKRNLFVFVVILVLIVAACAGIMIYAAKNGENQKPQEDGVSDQPANAVVSVEDTQEAEESSDVLTTIATTVAPTTAPETTTKAPETTTKAPETTKPVTTTQNPTTTQAPATEAYTGAYETYTVQAGDNFYSILRSFGIADTPANVQKMCDFNGISVYSGLSVGQTLKVPLE